MKEAAIKRLTHQFDSAMEAQEAEVTSGNVRLLTATLCSLMRPQHPTLPQRKRYDENVEELRAECKRLRKEVKSQTRNLAAAVQCCVRGRSGTCVRVHRRLVVAPAGRSSGHCQGGSCCSSGES